ncbi:MAG: hypothetical protein NT013_24630, partial [Planctomycetia bacterium]|nr:hypothetical protein [Planctomycetia bacterium]
GVVVQPDLSVGAGASEVVVGAEEDPGERVARRNNSIDVWSTVTVLEGGLGPPAKGDTQAARVKQSPVQARSEPSLAAAVVMQPSEKTGVLARSAPVRWRSPTLNGPAPQNSNVTFLSGRTL